MEKEYWINIYKDQRDGIAIDTSSHFESEEEALQDIADYKNHIRFTFIKTITVTL